MRFRIDRIEVLSLLMIAILTGLTKKIIVEEERLIGKLTSEAKPRWLM